MKEKRVVAMFITSIVAFVASLTISLGVAFALADPVDAVGLAEISYTMSSGSYSQEVVLNPATAYIDDIEDGVYVHTYEHIQYANEALPNSITLLKVAVNNDKDTSAVFQFQISVAGETNAKNFVKYAIFNADTGLLLMSDANYEVVNGIAAFNHVTIQAGNTAHYVVAAYVDDRLCFDANGVDFATSMNMTVGVYTIN